MNQKSRSSIRICGRGDDTYPEKVSRKGGEGGGRRGTSPVLCGEQEHYEEMEAGSGICYFTAAPMTGERDGDKRM